VKLPGDKCRDETSAEFRISTIIDNRIELYNGTVRADSIRRPCLPQGHVTRSRVLTSGLSDPSIYRQQQLQRLASVRAYVPAAV